MSTSPLSRDPIAAPPSIEDRFAAYHAANPHVYDHLKVLALQLVDAGHDHVSIKMLFEVARFERLRAVDPRSPEKWALNNCYTASYARLLMAREPRLRGVFETRQLRSEAEQADVVSDADRRQLLARADMEGRLSEVAPEPVAEPGAPCDTDEDARLFDVEAAA